MPSSDDWRPEKVDNYTLQVAAKLTEADVCEAVTKAGENAVGTDDKVEEDQPAVYIPTNKGNAGSSSRVTAWSAK